MDKAAGIAYISLLHKPYIDLCINYCLVSYRTGFFYQSVSLLLSTLIKFYNVKITITKENTRESLIKVNRTY